MKRKLLQAVYFMATIILSSCNQHKETILFEKQENWGQWFAGDTTSIMYTMKATQKGNDTIYTTTYFYPNGIKKTKTLFVNDKLIKIYFVNDTTGNPYDFGKLNNGNGNVKQYSHQGILESSGNYKNGYKEGWWYDYHFKGEISDSILYKEGFNISDKNTTSMNGLIGSTRKRRNNLYN